jgi:integrase
MPLTDVACRNAKPGDAPRKISDGGGLYLLVQPSGSRLWRMNYRYAGKQKTLALGKYPAVSLSDARRQRDTAKEQLALGRDPSGRAKAPTNDFEAVAREWIAAREGAWSRDHSGRIQSRLATFIFPQIGKRQVGEIDAPMVLAALRKIEATGAIDNAHRALQSVGCVFRYAISTGRLSRDPTSDLKGALKPIPKPEHFAALKEKDISAFMKALQMYPGDDKTRLGIEVIAHTFVRTNELTGGTWDEVDGNLWRIPAKRMKSGREHIVPLTPHVLGLLDQLRQIDPVNIARLGENTMLRGLARIGYGGKLKIHGLRGTASTALNESGLWSPDAIEMQLAHVPGGVRGIYNAALYLPERRRMMGWWSDKLCS